MTAPDVGATRGALGKEVSVFVFEKRSAEKLHKPKRKETVTELLRGSVRQLERFRHPKVLQVHHPIEECNDTLAFASEPVLASLANILAFQEPSQVGPPATGASQHPPPQNTPRPPHAREYHFLDIELKYGILQVIKDICGLTSRPFLIIIIMPCSTLRLTTLDTQEMISALGGTRPVTILETHNNVDDANQFNITL
ncbi:hypothetical protein J6590_021247 [Homalodisca vitripennis]|nr:hypothetical protein J6590_021247 [Homalodisca vitripennis]